MGYENFDTSPPVAQFVRMNLSGVEWIEKLETARALRSKDYRYSLLPLHFLRSVFPKIGGEVFLLKYCGKEVGYVFCFPQNNKDNPYLARVETGNPSLSDEIVARKIILGLNLNGRLYNPFSQQSFEGSHSKHGKFNIGRPTEEEARVIPKLQKSVWGSDDNQLYPYDIHSQEFNLATSLVVREQGKMIGFLFGFYKLPKDTFPIAISKRYRTDIAVESQLMAILPQYRRSGLGFELKKRQGLQALAEQIDIVSWTADPLLFSNAVLNFNKLNAIAFNFYPAHYQFINRFNVVTASRLGLTWLLSSPRVMGVLESSEISTSRIPNLLDFEQIVVVNHENRPNFLKIPDAPCIAIEIPGDWAKLQEQNREEAARWRETTDGIFKTYLGNEGYGYAIFNAAQNKDGKCYLIAKRLEEIEGFWV